MTKVIIEWQEGRHRHRGAKIARNLALTLNAVLAIIPFDDESNLPEFISEYRQFETFIPYLILHVLRISLKIPNTNQ